MFKATAPVLSKANRRALTPKRGNKDFYKGTRQAYLPGGLRTGAPGVHVIKGKSKYRLLDEQVRYFVAPPIEDIVNSSLKPYVYSNVRLTKDQKHEVLGKFPQGGITPEHFLAVAPRTVDVMFYTLPNRNILSYLDPSQKPELGYYEPRYPEVDELVMVQVRQIAEMGAYVKLLEYDNIEGMILLSELSRRRIRSIQKLIRVGRNEVVVVLRVDKEKGYIDLSKRRVSPEDITKCEERYMKAKTVASIMRHVASKVPSTAIAEATASAPAAEVEVAPPEVASKVDVDDKSTKKSRRAARKAATGPDPEDPNAPVADDTGAPTGGAGEEERLEQLYDEIAWPLGKKYGHTYDAFKLALTEPETVFSALPPITPSTLSILTQTIARRLTPQAIKLRADIELTCYTPAGIDAIKKALKAGEKQSNDTVPIKAKLVAPPLYVLSTNATDKFAAVDRLERAIEAIQSTIEDQGGSLVIKMKPKAISETEEQDLAQLMAKAGQENAEVSGDEDEEEDVL